MNTKVKQEPPPLSPQALVQALDAAASTTQQRINDGTELLQAWEKKEGYYSLLQDVSTESSLPIEIRLLSLIQIKNGIDKYWRKHASNAIPTDERDKIRSRVLQNSVEEHEHQLVNLRTIVVSKIARSDWPASWPNLFQDLVQIVQSAATDHKLLSRSLQVVLQTIKALSTLTMQRARSAMYSSSGPLFTTIRDIYLALVDEWHKVLAIDEDPNVHESLELTLLSLKILRRIMTACFEFPHKENAVHDFWLITESHAAQYLSLYRKTWQHRDQKTLMGKHLIQLGKMHSYMARDHAVSFALLPGVVQLVHNYWNVAKALRDEQFQRPDMPEDDSTTFDIINLKALQMIRACVALLCKHTTSIKYRGASVKDDPPLAKELLSNGLLTPSFVHMLAVDIMTKFFVYVPTDLEIWVAEPEEWEMREEGDEDLYEQTVRPCAERLFLDLMLYYKDAVLSPLLENLGAVAAPSSNEMLAKDAMYCALGLAAPSLDKKFDFDNFMLTALVVDLQKSVQHANIIRRRIAILLAKWSPIGILDTNRPLVYQIFSHLLDKSEPANDEAVRITTAKRLRGIVDEWSFDATVFKSYGPDVLTRLLALVTDVALPETKMAILDTVSSVIERMDNDVGPFAERVVALLPPLWEESGAEHLMKQHIVRLLTHLVSAMKESSAPLQPMVLPIIKDAIQLGSVTSEYMLDDALDLWIVVVRESASPSSDLLSLLPSLCMIIDLAAENLDKALRILRSYILLAPADLLRDDIRPRLVHALEQAFANKKTESIDAVCETVECLLRAASTLGGEPGTLRVTEDCMNAHLLQGFVDSIHSDYETHQTTGPNRKEPPKDWKNETNYISVLSQIGYGSSHAFRVAVQAWADTRSPPNQDGYKHVIEEFFTHMDAIVDSSKQKLACMALTKQLETDDVFLLGKLQDYIAMWTSVIRSLQGEGEALGHDSLLINPETEWPTTRSPGENRTRDAYHNDPVHTVNIRDFIKHHLTLAITKAGGEQRFKQEWLSNVDQDVVKSFMELQVL